MAEYGSCRWICLKSEKQELNAKVFFLGFCEHIQMDVSYFCCGCSRGTPAAYGEYVMPNSTDGYRMLPEAGDPSGQHGSTFELVPAAKVDVGEAIRGII